MLIVAGFLQVAAHERDAYLALARESTELARVAPGCWEFVQAADPIEPDRIVIYERWESEVELLAFRSSGPDPEPDAVAPPMPEVLGADVRRYEISAVGAA